MATAKHVVVLLALALSGLLVAGAAARAAGGSPLSLSISYQHDSQGIDWQQSRQHAQGMLNDIHQQFIAAVREGRGDALRPNKEIFSGLFWTGRRAKELGLIDDFASASEVAREVIGAEEIADFTVHENILQRLADRFGAAMGRSIAAELKFQSRWLR